MSLSFDSIYATSQFAPELKVMNLKQLRRYANRLNIPLPPETGYPIQDFVNVMKTIIYYIDPDVKKAIDYYNQYKDINDNILSLIPYDEIETIMILVKAGANPNVVNDEGAVPLLYAIRYNNYNYAKLLLEHNADPNFIDHPGDATPLELAEGRAYAYADVYNSHDIVNLLIQHGAI